MKRTFEAVESYARFVSETLDSVESLWHRRILPELKKAERLSSAYPSFDQLKRQAESQSRKETGINCNKYADSFTKRQEEIFRAVEGYLPECATALCKKVDYSENAVREALRKAFKIGEIGYREQERVISGKRVKVHIYYRKERKN